jgi:hypothetical protein
LHHVWWKFLPDSVDDFVDFEPSDEFTQIKASCVALARQVGLEEVENEDVEELLQSHTEDLPTRDLQQLVAEGQVEAADDDDDDDDEVQQTAPQELNTSQLSSALSGIVKHFQWIEDNDYNAERSRIALHGIHSHLEPYKQLLYERRKLAKQQKLDFYFKPVQKKENRTMSHSHQPLVSQHFVLRMMMSFHPPLLHNSEATTLHHTHFHQANFMSFVKVKCYIYCSISLFIRNLRCLKVW